MSEGFITLLRKRLAHSGDAGSVRSLVSGTAGTGLVQAGGAAAGFAVQIILARVMGAEGFGVYTIALSVLLIGSTLSLGGMDRTFLRFLPVYRQSAQWGAFRGLLTGGSLAVLGLSTLLALGCAAFVWAARPLFEADLAPTLWFACAALPVFTLAQAFAGAVQALRRPVLAQFPIAIFRPVLLGVAAIAVWYLWGGFGGATAMALNAAVLALMCGLYLIFVARLRPRETRGVASEYAPAEWWAMTRSMWWIMIVALAMRRVDILLLGVFRGAEEAGIYGAAARLAELVVFALTALNVVFMPVAAELYHSGRRRELQRILGVAAWGLVAFSLPMSLALIFGGQWILGLYGEEFVAGHLALVVLVASQIANALSGPVGSLLHMTGHQRAASRVTTICFGLTIVLNLALIPPLGMLGAAIATGLTTTVINVALAIFAWRRIGLDPTVLGIRRK